MRSIPRQVNRVSKRGDNPKILKNWFNFDSGPKEITRWPSRTIINIEIENQNRKVIVIDISLIIACCCANK